MLTAGLVALCIARSHGFAPAAAICSGLSQHAARPSLRSQVANAFNARACRIGSSRVTMLRHDDNANARDIISQLRDALPDHFKRLITRNFAQTNVRHPNGRLPFVLRMSVAAKKYLQQIHEQIQTLDPLNGLSPTVWANMSMITDLVIIVLGIMPFEHGALSI